MPDAWMVRGHERQEFLETLSRKAFEAVDAITDGEGKEADGLYLELAFMIGGYLQGAVSSIRKTRQYDQLEKIYLNLDFLSKTEEFARSNAEQRVLLADLLRKFIDSATNSFYADLRREEIMEPQKIFHAESATADVVSEKT